MDDLLQDGWKSSRKDINGLTLHMVETGPDDGPLLLLLHGFPEFWWAWRHQIAPLAAQGFHVVVPDLRGYNLSDAPQDVAAYHLDTLTADVLALATAFGAERFHLVGHDWGGVIAWRVATLGAERLNSVVVMDAPHPDLWAAQALTHPTQALRSTYVALFQLPWLPEAALGAFDHAGLRAMIQGTARPGALAEGELDRYAEAWSHPGSLTGMLNYYRALRDRTREDKPQRIRTRALVLWGARDAFLEQHVARAGADLCDDGRLVIVEDTTHWLHFERPERINAELIAFLGAA